MQSTTSPCPPVPLSPCHPAAPLLSPLTLLIGEPATGKSLLALHLAAPLSQTPQSPPFATARANAPSIENQKSKIENPLPSSSIICSREDTHATILSRLNA